MQNFQKSDSDNISTDEIIKTSLVSAGGLLGLYLYGEPGSLNIKTVLVSQSITHLMQHYANRGKFDGNVGDYIIFAAPVASSITLLGVPRLSLRETYVHFFSSMTVNISMWAYKIYKLFHSK